MKTKDIQMLNTLEMGVMKYTAPAEYATEKTRHMWKVIDALKTVARLSGLKGYGYYSPQCFQNTLETDAEKLPALRGNKALVWFTHAVATEFWATPPGASIHPLVIAVCDDLRRGLSLKRAFVRLGYTVETLISNLAADAERGNA